jgi:hypothetical protein
LWRELEILSWPFDWSGKEAHKLNMVLYEGKDLWDQFVKFRYISVGIIADFELANGIILSYALPIIFAMLGQ